jgi:PHP family Zn ribbon phosphoesterase
MVNQYIYKGIDCDTLDANNMRRVAEIFNAFTTSDLQSQYREWLTHEFPELGVRLSKHNKLAKTFRGTDRIPLQKRLRVAQYENA